MSGELRQFPKLVCVLIEIQSFRNEPFRKLIKSDLTRDVAG